MSKPKLVCFTHAGGTSSFFDVIENDLLDIDVIKIDYAGHADRHKEPFYKNFDELADDLYSVVKEKCSNGDYALFGYSMGTISVVEILKRIINNQEMKLPTNIFLAAHEPKTKAELAGFSSDELDEWVKIRTIRFGGVPEVLLNNKSFWRMYLPIYRSDYSIIGKYNFEGLELISHVPTTIFYSEEDTKYDDMKDWLIFFRGDCEFYRFTGNHFFIKDHHTDIASIIHNKICGDKENGI